jgi:hypothetical protein
VADLLFVGPKVAARALRHRASNLNLQSLFYRVWWLLANLSGVGAELLLMKALVDLTAEAAVGAVDGEATGQPRSTFAPVPSPQGCSFGSASAGSGRETVQRRQNQVKNGASGRQFGRSPLHLAWLRLRCGSKLV